MDITINGVYLIAGGIAIVLIFVIRMVAKHADRSAKRELLNKLEKKFYTTVSDMSRLEKFQVDISQYRNEGKLSAEDYWYLRHLVYEEITRIRSLQKGENAAKSGFADLLASGVLLLTFDEMHSLIAGKAPWLNVVDLPPEQAEGVRSMYDKLMTEELEGLLSSKSAVALDKVMQIGSDLNNIPGFGGKSFQELCSSILRGSETEYLVEES